jgi:hypothetical protein
MMRDQLQSSAENGCGACRFFWQACKIATVGKKIDYVSAWSASGGVFGLYVGLDQEGEKLVPSPAGTVANMPGLVLVLAANGGKPP